MKELIASLLLILILGTSIFFIVLNFFNDFIEKTKDLRGKNDDTRSK
jgi:hypothetical protein